MSHLSCLPAYFVFGQQHLEVATCAVRVAQYAADKAQESEHRAVLVFLDQVLLHAIPQVQEHVRQIQQVGLAVASLSHVSADGTCFLLSSAFCNIQTAVICTLQHPLSLQKWLHACCKMPAHFVLCFGFFHQLSQTCNESSVSA